MNNETMIKRLTKAGMITKAGRLHLKYYSPVREIGELAKGDRRHLLSWGHKFGSLNDTLHRNTRALLDALMIGYKVGNDAPKGGVTGTYIELTASGRKVAKTCIDNLNAILG